MNGKETKTLGTKCISESQILKQLKKLNYNCELYSYIVLKKCYLNITNIAIYIYTYIHITHKIVESKIYISNNSNELFHKNTYNLEKIVSITIFSHAVAKISFFLALSLSVSIQQFF